jgi:hypothetical protein
MRSKVRNRCCGGLVPVLRWTGCARVAVDWCDLLSHEVDRQVCDLLVHLRRPPSTSRATTELRRSQSLLSKDVAERCLTTFVRQHSRSSARFVVIWSDPPVSNFAHANDDCVRTQNYSRNDTFKKIILEMIKRFDEHSYIIKRASTNKDEYKIPWLI